MAESACPSCRRLVSPKAQTCPHCGHPLTNVLTRRRGCGTLIVTGIAAVAVIAIIGRTRESQAPAAPAAFGPSDALELCRQAIRNASINPNTAVVPWRDGLADQRGWTYSWPHNSGLQLQNGFGAMVAGVATCKVSATSHAITTLTINGHILR